MKQFGKFGCELHVRCGYQTKNGFLRCGIGGVVVYQNPLFLRTVFRGKVSTHGCSLIFGLLRKRNVCIYRKRKRERKNETRSGMAKISFDESR